MKDDIWINEVELLYTINYYECNIILDNGLIIKGKSWVDKFDAYNAAFSELASRFGINVEDLYIRWLDKLE